MHRLEGHESVIFLAVAYVSRFTDSGYSQFNGRLCALHEEVTDPYRILCSKISVPR